MTTVSLRSFSSGELSPSLYARVDQARYATGLRVCRNATVLRSGGIENRPGFEWISLTKDIIPSSYSKLFPFVFNDDQTYVIEAADQCFRFIKDGVYVTEEDKTITGGWTNSASGIFVTITAHGFSNGDLVVVKGFEGLGKNVINNKSFYVYNASTNSFTLTSLGAGESGLDSFTPNSTGTVTIGKAYEIATPYAGADLETINYAQNADVMTFVHPDYPPYDLSRFADNDWTLEAITFSPDINEPRNVSAVKGSAGTNTYKYKVTAFKNETGEESLAGLGSSGITALTNANPAVVTSNAHPFVNGESVYIDGVGGMTEINGSYYTVAGAAANTFQLTGVDSSAYGTYSNGGAIYKTISGVTNADPCVVTTGTVHGLTTGDEVHIDGVVGTSELNNREYSIEVLTTTTFALVDVDSTDYGTYSSGGYFGKTSITITAAGAPTTGAPHVLSWYSVSGADEYNIYKETNGAYGQIGIASGTTTILTFNDEDLVEANTGFQPPRASNPFLGTNNYPSVVTYVQQRKGFAATNNDPEKIWLSRIGNYKNFTYSSPVQDDDAVIFTLAGKEVNIIRSMIDLGRLVVLTSGGEWAVNGNDAGTILPTEINAKQYSYNGGGELSPIPIDSSVLYQQARGSIIRDLAFSFEVDGYQGNDLTVFSNHLFDGYTIKGWAYQQIPQSIVWILRSDGVLLGLTYVKSQNVLAWHRHDTGGIEDSEDGFIEEIISVPEGNKDVVYLVVKRRVFGVGTYYKYIEKLSERSVDDLEKAVLVDSAWKFDGSDGTEDFVLVIANGTYAVDDTVNMFRTAGTWQNADVGRRVELTRTDSLGDVVNIVKVEIVSPLGANATVKFLEAVTIAPGASVTSVRFLITKINFVGNLEDQEVAVIADGEVVHNPFNSDYSTATIDGGSLELTTHASKISIGKPYLTDIETLDIDSVQGETLSDKRQNISKLTFHVKDSKGIWAGVKAPSDDSTDASEGLQRISMTNQETDQIDNSSYISGKVDVNIESEWNQHGRVFVRQLDPYPMTILAIHPAGLIPVRN